MTIKELTQILAQFPDDMPVVTKVPEGDAYDCGLTSYPYYSSDVEWAIETLYRNDRGAYYGTPDKGLTPVKCLCFG